MASSGAITAAARSASANCFASSPIRSRQYDFAATTNLSVSSSCSCGVKSFAISGGIFSTPCGTVPRYFKLSRFDDLSYSERRMRTPRTITPLLFVVTLVKIEAMGAGGRGGGGGGGAGGGGARGGGGWP